MYRKWLAGIALLALYTPSQAQKISSKEVQRIISTLAADDMQGRKTFEPGIDKAAAFVEEEFSKAGLKPLPGANSLRQSFYMYRVKPLSVKLSVNGQERTPEDVIVQSGAPQLSWTSGSGVTERRIGATDTLFQRLRDLRNAKGDMLVWVDTAQTKAFRQYQGYLKEGGLQTDTVNSVVLVLGQPGDSAANWELAARQEVNRLPLGNLAGIIPGSSRPEEYVIFSAHYDHIGILPPVAQDSIANGADDDASGTTAVIMLANYYRQRKPARTLVFVAFTGEEMGGYGSRYFSQQLAPEKITAMFNIEMIGKESKFGKNSAFITGFERSDFGPILQRNLQGSEFQFHPDPYPEQQLFYRSDNATLARLGVPAHTISTTQIDKDKLYHSVDDEVESLDIENITTIIRAIAQSAGSIVDGKDTPTRISGEP
jgi:hypothetical protein